MFSRELRLRNALKEIDGDYDVVFIDCHPRGCSRSMRCQRR